MKIFPEKALLKRLLKQGFTLIELLTTVGVVGTLTVLGIRSYQTQTGKARSAEAKHSLSYIYTAENNFRSVWGAYHENLMVIGAVPSGSYYYDAGFGKSAVLSKTDGSLGDYPSHMIKSLDVKECANFHQICGGNCLTQAASAVGSPYDAYFDPKSPEKHVSAPNCRVSGGLHLKGYTAAEGCGAGKSGATASCFRALAIGKIKSDDVWSIDQQKIITHEKDGTE